MSNSTLQRADEKPHSNTPKELNDALTPRSGNDGATPEVPDTPAPEAERAQREPQDGDIAGPAGIIGAAACRSPEPLVRPHSKTSAHELGFTCDDEFEGLFFQYRKKPAEDSFGQLQESIRFTKHVAPLVVWDEENILIDGYRRVRAWESFAPEVRAEIPPPQLIRVSLPCRAAALVERFNLKNSALMLSEDERVLTVLRNRTLREELRRLGEERKLKGTKAEPGAKGDVLSQLARAAKASRDRLYKWTVVLERPDADDTIKAVLGGKDTLYNAYRIAKAKAQDTRIDEALRRPTPQATVAAGTVIDTVLFGRAEDEAVWDRIPEIHLTVTSPPYAHKTLWEPYGKPYPGYKGWLALMERVLTKVFERTVDGGKCVINVSDVTVPPDEGAAENPPALRRDCCGDLKLLAKGIGWTWRDSVIWRKQNADSDRPMVGGKRSARFNTAYEWLIVFGKGKRDLDGDQRVINDQQFYGSLVGGVWDIDHIWNADGTAPQGDGIWDIFPERRSNLSPCQFPYPEVIPASFIGLLAYRGQTVLDPFAGSGTTLTAAKKLGLHYVGIEDNEPTFKYALHRLSRVQQGDEIDPWQTCAPPAAPPRRKKWRER